VETPNWYLGSPFLRRRTGFCLVAVKRSFRRAVVSRAAGTTGLGNVASGLCCRSLRGAIQSPPNGGGSLQRVLGNNYRGFPPSNACASNPRGTWGAGEGSIVTLKLVTGMDQVSKRGKSRYRFAYGIDAGGGLYKPRGNLEWQACTATRIVLPHTEGSHLVGMPVSGENNRD